MTWPRKGCLDQHTQEEEEEEEEDFNQQFCTLVTTRVWSQKY
jgi:hypothetical protein